jgi:hypothetical protein
MVLRVDNGNVNLVVDGVLILTLPTSAFAASATKATSFGYVNNGAAQQWTCYWQRPTEIVVNKQNFWNLQRSDGILAAGSDQLTSGAGLFVAGHNNKRIRILGTDPKNDEEWIVVYVDANHVHLTTIQRTEATVTGTVATGTLVKITEPRFNAKSVTKSIVITDSALGNNGTYAVLEWIDAWTVRVNRATDFVPESGLDWKWYAGFATEVSVHWEIVDVGTAAGAVLTLADNLPAAISDVRVRYTTVLSGEVLEEVSDNTGFVPHLYYPAYLADVDADLRDILTKDITAAGVIPRFTRPW